MGDKDQGAWNDGQTQGQKSDIRDKAYIETAARNGKECLYTEFANDELRDTLEKGPRVAEKKRFAIARKIRSMQGGRLYDKKYCLRYGQCTYSL